SYSQADFSVPSCLPSGSIFHAWQFRGARVRDMSEVTSLVKSIRADDPEASAQLLTLVYDELRRLAARRLAREAPGQTIQATARAHEASRRLVGDKEGQQWGGRGPFFAAAVEAMRRILVERARRERSLKRGGALVRHQLEEAELMAPDPREDLL